MGIFFGLGHAKLLIALFAEIIAQRIFNHLRRVSNRQGKLLVILCGADIGQWIYLLFRAKPSKSGKFKAHVISLALSGRKFINTTLSRGLITPSGATTTGFTNSSVTPFL